MNINNEDFAKEIINELNNGKTIKQVAKEKFMQESELRRVLFSHGGEEGRNLLIDELEGVLPIRQIVQKYKEYKQKDCLIKLYDEYENFGKSKILDFIRRYEIITGERVIDNIKLPTHKKKLVVSDKELYDRNQNGETYKQLADEYHVSVTVIRNRIRQYKESVEENEPVHNLDNKDKRIKLATLNSVERILYKYDYTYQELCKIATEAGYVVRKEDYDKALKNLGKKYEGRDE